MYGIRQCKLVLTGTFMERSMHVHREHGTLTPCSVRVDGHVDGI